jgi:hypothetical protein
VTQAARQAGCSAWRIHVVRRLKRLLLPDEVSGSYRDEDFKKLLDIALVDPVAARELNKAPEKISIRWQKYKLASALNRRRRKTWMQRMQDAFPGWYQRWLLRFHPDELDAVRYNTVLFCFDQLSAQQKERFLNETNALK